jgi:hypothetical protein
MNVLVAPQELPRVGIERQISESQSHAAALRKTQRNGMTLQRLPVKGRPYYALAPF